MTDVYITRVAKFLPNDPVSNDEMEPILGMVGGRPSRARRIVLRQNGIKFRYYVIDRSRRVTHNNAQITAEAVRRLADEHCSVEDIELLSCGTSSPDQLVPSHASMVHGVLKSGPMEVHSPAGICCSGMQALKHGYLSVASGMTRNAVCSGSETVSFALLAHKYVTDGDATGVERDPALAFEREFLRWMLSDGAGAVLMESRPRGLSLRIDWVETVSFANELDVCMFTGCERQRDGTVQSFHQFDYETIVKRSLLVLQQDVRLLNANIVRYAVMAIARAAAKRDIRPCDVDYFVPHLSSEYFRAPLARQMEQCGVGVPLERWFTNLDRVGNVGAASIYLALEELFNSERLQKGQRLWLAVPESGRFLYSQALVTVC
jgi:3-oxoacyl-[acyl-carrier-protein] synthase-3